MVIDALTGGYEDKTLFQRISLSFPKGAFIALAGPNGSGKSSLLKFLYKQLKPKEGAIRVEQADLSTLKQKALAQRIGFVPQDGRLDFSFTVEETVAMGRYANPLPDDVERIHTAMETCSVLELRDTPVTRISGGELQRTLLARALAQDGKILLLDEPVNHLDIAHQRSVMHLLQDLVKGGYTVVAVLHDLLLAQAYSSWIIFLKDGAVAAYGPTAEVVTEEILKSVYGVESHRIFDPRLDKELLIPAW
ncbi:MAG: ABC transporter ATP-binding protein [Spirochaetales bacterium]|nr:ABC transporter ATP-binding protein [Spirochaetales bacterium]